MARTPDPNEAEFVRRVREPRAASAEPGRHRARRSAMMLLYRADLTGTDPEDAIASFEREHGFAMPSYGAEVVRGIHARPAQVDAALEEHLTDWRLDRLGAVERAVLRIAMWELQTDAVPAPVAIDEAVELAKRYATPEAAVLVNGVLSGWLRAGETGAAPAQAADEEEE